MWEFAKVEITAAIHQTLSGTPDRTRTILGDSAALVLTVQREIAGCRRIVLVVGTGTRVDSTIGLIDRVVYIPTRTDRPISVQFPRLDQMVWVKKCRPNARDDLPEVVGLMPGVLPFLSRKERAGKRSYGRLVRTLRELSWVDR